MTKSAAEKKKYPIGAEYYELYEEIGQGASATVRRALCVPLNEIVAIKILDFERDNSDLNSICREAQTMVLVDHQNVLKAHCSFVSDHNLWVVTPFMAGGSCLHILKAARPDGFEEVVIATILREVLKGLEYLHSEGHIHRDVKAGNILLDSTGAVKLGDFGVSACLFDSGDRQVKRNTFVGTPCWMAPEVMEQLRGYDFKADIWSFGITALELAHGHAPFSKYPPMKVLLMTLQNAPPGLDYERDKKFSKSFKDMIASCLVKDPSKRPAAKKLLKHSFFKQAKSKDLIARKLLEGLPTLGDRIKALKRKEEDMLAQKEIPDVQMEEISQNEYKRGISGWNFNLDDMKAQASLINDVDHSESDNNIGGSSDSLLAQDVDGNQLKCPPSSDMEDDLMHKQPLSSVKLAAHINNCYRSDDESSATDFVSQTSSPCNGAYSESNLDEKATLEARRRSLEEVSHNSKQGGEVSRGTVFLPEVNVSLNRMDSEKWQRQQQCSPTCNGAAGPQTGDDVPPEIPPQYSNPSVNSDDLEEKPKVPVVQQRGRFKITSENADMQKVTPHPVLQKSLSMQVLNQHPSPSLASLSSPSAATSSTLASSSLFSVLHSALNDNIVQRENILYVMKLLTTADSAGSHAPDAAQVAAVEKSALETAHEKEKDMLNELSELQWRLICAQEELQKYKKEDVQFSSS